MGISRWDIGCSTPKIARSFAVPQLARGIEINGRAHAKFRAKRGIWVERSATSEPYERELSPPSGVIPWDNGTRVQRGRAPQVYRGAENLASQERRSEYGGFFQETLILWR